MPRHRPLDTLDEDRRRGDRTTPIFSPPPASLKAGLDRKPVERQFQVIDVGDLICPNRHDHR